MKIRTSELTGAALNWVVEQIEQPPKKYDHNYGGYLPFEPADFWDQGGPIIEQEGISIKKGHSGWWIAKLLDINDDEHFVTVAPTPLIAAMRCLVASKLGDEVEVPDELIQGE